MSYIIENPDIIAQLTWEHIVLTVGALFLATVIAVPLGYAIYGRERISTVVLGGLGILYVIPSLVLMILLLPLLGLNERTVIAALVIYCQIILVRNVIAGLASVDPSVMEAAKGLGMTRWQQFTRVQLPLASPIIIAGMRLAAVVATSIATVGALFGAGGLGTLLFNGVAQGRYDKIVAGSIMVALLAAFFNWSLQAVERRQNRAAHLADA